MDTPVPQGDFIGIAPVVAERLLGEGQLPKSRTDGTAGAGYDNINTVVT